MRKQVSKNHSFKISRISASSILKKDHLKPTRSLRPMRSILKVRSLKPNSVLKTDEREISES